MRKLLLICLVLTACSKPAAVNTAVNGVLTQVQALETSLPDECKTDGIKAQIGAIKSQLTTIVETCSVEKQSYQEKIRKYQLAIGFLIVLIVAYVGYLIRK